MAKQQKKTKDEKEGSKGKNNNSKLNIQNVKLFCGKS